MGGGKDIFAGDQKAPWQLCVNPGSVKERNPRGKAHSERKGYFVGAGGRAAGK